MKILIASDFALIRNGIQNILIQQFDRVELGEASSADELLPVLQREHWDTLLLDEYLQEGKGVDMVCRIREKLPQLPIMLMNFQRQYQSAVHAIRAGVRGYLTRYDIPEHLPDAIQKVLNGGRYLSPSITERLAEAVHNERCVKEIHELLSDREWNIMLMLGQGKSPKRIAYDLHLSIKTISTYRGRALKKMKMQNNAEFISYAVKHNLIQSRY